MKKTTRLAAMLLCAVLLLAGFASAIEVVDPTEAFYVADYANILSEETENYIVSKNDSLYSLTGGQIVVVTIEFLGGQDIEEYARTLMNEWKIGSAEYNNGLLLLLVTGEANYWAVQGSGIEVSLTASLLGDYLNEYLEPQFVSGNYDTGVMNVFDAFLGWYDRFYSVNVGGGNEGAVNNGNTGILDPSGTGGNGVAPSDTDGVDDPLSTDHTIKKGGIIGKIAGIFLIVVLILLVAVVSVVAIPRTIYLRRRGYRYGIFNRAFWSHRPPPPPRRPRGPRPGPGPRPPMGGMGMGGAPRPGMGNPPPRSGPRPSGPRMGGGGSTRGGGAGRSSFGGGRSSFGGSRPGGGPRMGGGGGTRGGGAGRK